MRKLCLLVSSLLAIGLLSNCTFINNASRYQATTKEFVEDLLHKDYDKCVHLMAMDNAIVATAHIDTLKMGLASFRNVIVNNFGEKLDYLFMQAEKKWSTNENESTASGTTKVLMQFSNKKDFGVLQVLFDDKSRKIINIKTLDIKAAIPNMTSFWLFGLLAICVPIFNVYMIVRVKRSQYHKKWPKYLAIILLNVPTITYKALGGLSFALLSFQILLGVSFEYMGYINSAWAVGIPVGGLYVLWQLWKGKDKLTQVPSNDRTILQETIFTDIAKPKE